MSEVKNINRKAVLDWVIAALALVVLVVCFFFWGCKYDMYVTILAAVVLVAGSTLLAVQTKKLKEKSMM